MKKRNIIILTSVVLVECLYSMDMLSKSHFSLPLSVIQKQTGYITNPLSDIEKQLVAEVVRHKGKARVLDMIKCRHRGQILQFKGVFYVDQITQCPLTRNVFAKIRTIEEKSWYCTRVTPHYKNGRLIALQPPTNYLGDSTRYIWNRRFFKTKNTKVKTDESSVFVKACFTEEKKDLLLEFVNKCDVRCGVK